MSPADRRPLYARVLRLTYVRPNAWWCAFFFEGMIGLAVLLSLAELVDWWSVLLLPLCVAAFVKINDIVKGSYANSEMTRRIPLRRKPVARGTATVRPVVRPRDRRVLGGADIDAPTEVLPHTARVRAARRRTPDRRFAPAQTLGRGEQSD